MTPEGPPRKWKGILPPSPSDTLKHGQYEALLRYCQNTLRSGNNEEILGRIAWLDQEIGKFSSPKSAGWEEKHKKEFVDIGVRLGFRGMDLVLDKMATAPLRFRAAPVVVGESVIDAIIPLGVFETFCQTARTWGSNPVIEEAVFDYLERMGNVMAGIADAIGIKRVSLSNASRQEIAEQYKSIKNHYLPTELGLVASSPFRDRKTTFVLFPELKAGAEKLTAVLKNIVTPPQKKEIKTQKNKQDKDSERERLKNQIGPMVEKMITRTCGPINGYFEGGECVVIRCGRRGEKVVRIYKNQEANGLQQLKDAHRVVSYAVANHSELEADMQTPISFIERPVAGGEFGIVANWIRGQPLTDIDLSSTSEIYLVVLEAARTMGRIYQKTGIIHTDPTAGNLYLVDSQSGVVQIVVADFDHAVLANSRSHGIGKPGWAPPELCERQTLLSERTDTYQMGVLLYFLLTGEEQAIIENKDDPSVKPVPLFVIRENEVKRPAAFAERFPEAVKEGFPPEARKLIERATNLDLSKRYSWVELIRDLGRITGHEPFPDH